MGRLVYAFVLALGLNVNASPNSVAVEDATRISSWQGSEGARTLQTETIGNRNKLKNSALVFIKPHANTKAVQNLVKSKLGEVPSLTILSEFDIPGTQIDKKKLIDRHYYSIASKATLLSPDKMNVPAEKFEAFFGEPWKKVLAEGRAVNAMQACKRFGCDAATLDEAWKASEAKSKVAKFGGGFYCGLLSVNNSPPLYVFNGFFMAMRARFVGKNVSIRFYEVEWDEEDLPWAKFRGQLLGPTDPSKAPRRSLRRTILDRYEELGLDSRPNKGDNGVHASASPFEGLAEKANWMRKRFGRDNFGRALIDRGISKRQLHDWSLDPQVILPEGTRGSLFDALEDLDAAECADKLVAIKNVQ